MATTATTSRGRTPFRLTEADGRLEDFAVLVDQTTELVDYPNAVEVQLDVVVYDSSALRTVLSSVEGRDEIEAELVHALTDGPGVAAFKGAFPDASVVDRATAAFEEIIAAEKASGGRNDHFAQAGANDRVWNALEKLAVRDPGVFVDYYGTDILALVSTAWLGPGYQIDPLRSMSSVEGEGSGSASGLPLGFLFNEVAAPYPAHMHLLSPVLTLQGAVAHSEMLVESGPTMYLPYFPSVRHRLPGLAPAGVS